jgi:ABC-type Zn uptake system ZnuABC Zn-binding protein ZnuA
MSPRAAQSDLDRQVAATHKRFVKAMDDRLGAMSPETKDAYFVILTKLVTKLETEEKPLKEIMQEMVAEAMTEVLQMIQA